MILTNTTPSPATAASLTAFAFNNPSGLITGATLFATTNPNFGLIGTGDNGVGVTPFGNADFGVSIGDSWQGSGPGGGNPAGGICIGDTATFTIDFTGTNLDTLTTLSFVNELTVGPGNGQGPVFSIARFRGIKDASCDSDKVPAVPVPPTVLLMGSGLLGLGLLGFRRKRKS